MTYEDRYRLHDWQKLAKLHPKDITPIEIGVLIDGELFDDQDVSAWIVWDCLLYPEHRTLDYLYVVDGEFVTQAPTSLIRPEALLAYLDQIDLEPLAKSWGPEESSWTPYEGYTEDLLRAFAEDQKFRRAV